MAQWDFLSTPNTLLLQALQGKNTQTPQWWEIVQNSRSVILDDFKGKKNVIVRTIDNFDRNHDLSLLYEYEKDGGKVVVCSCDFDKLPTPLRDVRSLILLLTM